VRSGGPDCPKTPYRVWLLEAGPATGAGASIGTARLAAFVGDRFNWNYASDPDPLFGNERRLSSESSSRVSVGSSSINGMVDIRVTR